MRMRRVGITYTLYVDALLQCPPVLDPWLLRTSCLPVFRQMQRDILVTVSTSSGESSIFAPIVAGETCEISPMLMAEPRAYQLFASNFAHVSTSKKPKR